jgi:hypothetical protein
MVDLVDARLDEAVKEGRITQEQATETLARAKERADSWVAGEETGRMGRGLGLGLLFGPEMGPGPDGPRRGGMGRGPGGGFGGHGPMGDDTDAGWGTSTTSAASTSWRV